jgi:hypothetical protein
MERKIIVPFSLSLYLATYYRSTCSVAEIKKQVRDKSTSKKTHHPLDNNTTFCLLESSGPFRNSHPFPAGEDLARLTFKNMD